MTRKPLLADEALAWGRVRELRDADDVAVVAGDGDGDDHRRAGADDLDADSVADTRGADQGPELAPAAHRRTVERAHGLARVQAGASPAPIGMVHDQPQPFFPRWSPGGEAVVGLALAGGVGRGFARDRYAQAGEREIACEVDGGVSAHVRGEEGGDGAAADARDGALHVVARET